jgi:hypothetical protein
MTMYALQLLDLLLSLAIHWVDIREKFAVLRQK